MPKPPVTLLNVSVSVAEGRFSFDPPPGNAGYQFGKGCVRGTIVFKLDSSTVAFCGCRFHPTKGNMPGIETRWSSASRNADELAATFESPQGAIFDGNLHLYCILIEDDSVLTIDPQVGNDGETGDGG